VGFAHARTTICARRLLVDRVLAGHRPGEVAQQLGVRRQTVYKWVRRYRAQGPAGLADRSARPHRLARLTSAEDTAAMLLKDEQVMTDLEALRKLGVRIGIDDFGTSSRAWRHRPEQTWSTARSPSRPGRGRPVPTGRPPHGSGIRPGGSPGCS
jgi:transposase